MKTRKMVSNNNHKKDLEIVYNLQWKNSSGHGDDKANIVGMYDIPATTLNWETFKSYLLKNSGATVDDVKVYYVCDDKEFRIESQLDFQLALYSFRQKARNGDIINLRLDRISEQNKMTGGRVKRFRRSGATQLDEEKPAPVENNIPASAVNNDNPPDWFKKFMKGFKKEIIDEVTTSVVNHLSNAKPPSNPPLSALLHTRKAKMDCCKRPKKVSAFVGKTENEHKGFLRSLKLERKLDCKLEKLEHKTQRIKERKLALLHSNADLNRVANKRNSNNDGDDNNGDDKNHAVVIPLLSDVSLSDTELLMDASPVCQHEVIVPHMSGGETYHQEWHVVNTGDMKWTDETELRYAWGSEALKPLEKSVPCPPLNPGEKGIVSVYLEVPKKAGNYESYWHFHHKGRRFGHWLGCRVIVEPPTIKTQSTIEDDDVILCNWTSTPKPLTPTMFEIKEEKANFDVSNINVVDEGMKKMCSLSFEQNLPHNDLLPKIDDFQVQDVSDGLEDLKIYDSIIVNDSNSSSDSDNQSIISIADSNSSLPSPSDEFVVIPVMPRCSDDGDEINEKENNEIKDENRGNGAEINIDQAIFDLTIKKEKIDNNEPRQINESHQQNINFVVRNKNESGFAYVNVNGVKIPVPKQFLRPDYLATAEEAPAPFEFPIPPPSISPTPTIDSLAPTINTSTTPSIILLKEENNITSSVIADIPEESPLLKMDESKADESIISDAVTSTSTSTTIKDFNAESQHESMSSSRLFMFPSNMPGFEVFPTPKPFSGSLPPELNMSSHATNQSSNIFNETISSSTNSSSPGQFYHYGFGSYTPTTTPSNTENIFGYSYSYPHSHFRVPMWHPSAHANQQLIPPENTQYVPSPLAEHVNFPNVSYETDEPNHSLVVNDGTNCSPTGACNMPPHFLGAAPKRIAPVLIPNTFVSGAVNVASSAINTARSVINMFSPPAKPQETEQREYWYSPNAATTTSPTNTAAAATEQQESPRERALRTLNEMGFWDHNLNSTLLARHNNDVQHVISELVN